MKMGVPLLIIGDFNTVLPQIYILKKNGSKANLLTEIVVFCMASLEIITYVLQTLSLSKL